MKLRTLLLTAIPLVFSVEAHATTVNIDATQYGYNSTAGATVGSTYSLVDYDPWGGNYPTLQLTLDAGTYSWSNAAGLVGASYIGYSYALGGTSYAWDFAAFDDSTKALLFTGGIDHQSSISAGLALAGALTGTFSLSQTTTLDFAVRDYFRADNIGGVSLNITKASAVPEPEVYAMMLAGLGMIGLIAKRRKQG